MKTQKTPYKIFVPEWVPLTNKGEEAIIRGMGDIIFPNDDVVFYVLDMNTRVPYEHNGIVSLPGLWFYPKWRTREFRLGLKPRLLYNSMCSLIRSGFDRLCPKWLLLSTAPARRYSHDVLRLKADSTMPRRERDRYLGEVLRCDYMIVGHDGGFNEYVADIVQRTARASDMKFGLFGSSLKPKCHNKVMLRLFGDFFDECDFAFCRDKAAFEWGARYFPERHIRLAPDPAFGMKPAADYEVDRFIAEHGLEQLWEKPVVMFTPAEPAPIERYSFHRYSRARDRLSSHRRILAELVRYVVDDCDANVLFLPHSIGPARHLDDRIVARSILRFVSARKGRVELLETECSARMLKGLIGRADFIVGERIHSLIAAIGMSTPFLCLGVKQDFRVLHIIGDMCGCRDQIHLLNDSDAHHLCQAFRRNWEKRDQLRSHLTEIHRSCLIDLTRVGEEIRAHVARRGAV